MTLRSNEKTGAQENGLKKDRLPAGKGVLRKKNRGLFLVGDRNEAQFLSDLLRRDHDLELAVFLLKICNRRETKSLCPRSILPYSYIHNR